MIDDPAAYNHYRQDGRQHHQQQEDPRQYPPDYPEEYPRDYPRDYPKEDPQDYQREDRQDGYARQISGNFNGYGVKDNLTYDDEPLVRFLSGMLLPRLCISELSFASVSQRVPCLGFQVQFQTILFTTQTSFITVL